MPALVCESVHAHPQTDGPSTADRNKALWRWCVLAVMVRLRSATALTARLESVSVGHRTCLCSRRQFRREAEQAGRVAEHFADRLVVARYIIHYREVQILILLDDGKHPAKTAGGGGSGGEFGWARLPVPGQKLVKVLDGVIGDAGEQIGEPSLRIGEHLGQSFDRRRAGLRRLCRHDGDERGDHTST
jgi:hypothetical protein